MALNREKIRQLVEVFYQPPFKTFYINSVDGETFVKPTGVFVSLGITTSLKVLESIRDVLVDSKEYNAVLVEMSSKRVGGQFLNKITNMTPEQYKIEELPTGAMGLEKSMEELAMLKSKLNPEEDLATLQIFAPKISKLSDLIEKLNTTDGWESHLIQKENDDYKIFHQYINYKKEDDIEYRLGIYVTEL